MSSIHKPDYEYTESAPSQRQSQSQGQGLLVPVLVQVLVPEPLLPALPSGVEREGGQSQVYRSSQHKGRGWGRDTP